MFTELNIFKMAHAMASHAGRRQGVIAQNMANADTPGYAARDIPSFGDLLANTGTTTMRQTREGHFAKISDLSARRSGGLTNPGSNTVSLEAEMLKAAEITQQHDRALAIYRSSLSVLRSSLG